MYRAFSAYRKYKIFLPRNSYISTRGKVTVSPCFSVGENCKILAEDSRDIVQIGKNVSINNNCMVISNNGGKIIIGDFVMIGPNTVFRASSHRFNEIHTPMRLQSHEPGCITIADNVWIGANCSILSNVCIGEGSVVGAGSVVNKDIPPFEIWGGVPAKFIKKRS